ncbi:hypothetical protein [Desulfolucanica intricata]|uniref:hypothetical protein n=1 Tax=Desulfolucanica intricata TaxID=1285191 RepID=UPI000834CE42|nr:hypothetical protein [Desulfolucanica intricata]
MSESMVKKEYYTLNKYEERKNVQPDEIPDNARPVDYFKAGYKANGNYQEDAGHNEEAAKFQEKVRKQRLENGMANPIEYLQAGFKQVDEARQAEEDANTTKGYNLKTDK